MSAFASGGRQMSRPFRARFPGICENCQEGFEEGEQVMYEGDDLVHADPDDCTAMAPRHPSEVLCESCWLVHAGECM